MQSTLSKYLSPEVTRTLIDLGQDPQAEVGRQEELTVLFTDIRDFTSISEAQDARTVVEYLNAYLGEMTGIVFDHLGTLDKFVGDAIMAFWGAPLKNDQHAEYAVRCALTMHKAVERRRAELGASSPFAFRTGVGVNTGPVVVGNIGSTKRLDYTVIGDNVNLASRIEGMTKQYKVPVLIGESTYRKIGNSFLCRTVDEEVQIKGKTQYIKLFQPLCEASDPEKQKYEELVKAFENAVRLFRSANLEAALKQFTVLAVGLQDGLSMVFADRCKQRIASPQEKRSAYEK
jgi:adenylate cyclase